jgi:hypothetical protein
MKLVKEILQIILAIILMAGGFGLVINFINGLLIIGVILIVAGIMLLLHVLRVAVISK